MATKKTTTTTETEEAEATAAAQEAETESAAAEETSGSGQAATEGTDAAAEKLTLVYIGPSIPRSKLRNAQIITGTEEEIREYLDDLKASYPEIQYLLVPPAGLAAAQKKVQTDGNILHKYYEDMAAKARVQRGRE